jgi:hypothetical protein
MPRTKKQIPEDCMPQCRTCAFYQAEQADEAGYCRRYPPQFVTDDETIGWSFPVVVQDDWCGEFKRQCN